jgi:hypothetical protein
VPLKPSAKQQSRAAGAPSSAPTKRAESGRLNLAIKRTDDTNKSSVGMWPPSPGRPGRTADAEFVKQVQVEAIELGRAAVLQRRAKQCCGSSSDTRLKSGGAPLCCYYSEDENALRIELERPSAIFPKSGIVPQQAAVLSDIGLRQMMPQAAADLPSISQR